MRCLRLTYVAGKLGIIPYYYTPRGCKNVGLREWNRLLCHTINNTILMLQGAPKKYRTCSVTHMCEHPKQLWATWWRPFELKRPVEGGSLVRFARLVRTRKGTSKLNDPQNYRELELLGKNRYMVMPMAVLPVNLPTQGNSAKSISIQLQHLLVLGATRVVSDSYGHTSRERSMKWKQQTCK